MKEVVIAGYVRSPFTPAKKGEMAKVRPDELAGQVVKELISRNKVNPEDIEDMIMGCAFPEGEQGFNVARIVDFLAELPITVAGVTSRIGSSSATDIGPDLMSDAILLLKYNIREITAPLEFRYAKNLFR